MTKSLDEKGRPVTFDHLKSKKKPVTKRVPIALDSELADEFNEARARVDVYTRRIELKPDDTLAKKQLAEAEADLERLTDENIDNVVEFVFQSIGRKAFEDLIQEYPPTKKQIADAKKANIEDPLFDDETFSPALVYHSLVEPSLSMEQVQEIFDSPDWNISELTALVEGAVTVNQQRRLIDLKKGSGATRG